MSDTFRPIEILLSGVVPLSGLAAWQPVSRWLAVRNIALDRASKAALSLTVALLWVQAGGMLLGWLHRLHSNEVIGWCALGLLGCALFSPWRSRKRSAEPKLNLRGLVPPTLIGGIVVVAFLLEATVPSWFQDDMTYHLSLPRLFAMAGGYAQPDDNIFAAFPLGWESILAMLHALGPPPESFPPFNPRLITVWTAAGGALATAGLARQIGARRSHAAWAGVSLLLVPTFAEFSTLCYVEAYLVLLAVLATTLLLRAIDGDDALILPAGALAGAASSVKYPGLAIVFGLSAVLFIGLRSSPGRMGSLLGRFVLAATALGCPFYLRNIVERGNPIFPLAFRLFGGRGWDLWRANAYSQVLRNYGEGRTLFDYVMLPFRLLAAHDTGSGFEASLGPVVAAGAILTLFCRRPAWRDAIFPDPRRAAALALFAGFWFVFWGATTQQGRMFLIAVPPLLALAGAAVSGPNSRISSKVQDEGQKPSRRQYTAYSRMRLALGGVVLAASLAWAIPSEAQRWDYQETTGWLTRQYDANRVLSIMLPDTYPAEREIEKLVPANESVWLVWLHNYTYYLRRSWRADQIFEDERFSALLDASATPADFARAVTSAGFHHVLINEKFFLAEGSADRGSERTDRLRAKFAACLSSHEVVAEYRRGDVVLYRVGN